MITVNTQSAASILRQVLGVIATLFGILTQSVGSLQGLPVGVSAILTAAGPLVLMAEHYLNALTPSTLQDRIFAVIRQVLGVTATAFGIITASTGALHLPPQIAAILTATGPVILLLQHSLASPATKYYPDAIETTSREVTPTPQAGG